MEPLASSKAVEEMNFRLIVMKSDASMKTAILWGSWLEPQARGQGLSTCMYEKRIEWAKKHPTVEPVVVLNRRHDQIAG
jgi:hypothetical protein